MSDGIVVDANVMQGFTRSRIIETASDDRTVVELIAESHSFAIDVGGKMQNQWLETCGATYFGEWFFQNLREGVIKPVAAKLHESHKKKLAIECGMPQKREIFYVAVAVVTQKRYIVTRDMDFWEPKDKESDSGTREKIQLSRKGCVCRYLRKTLGVTVATPSMARQELGPQNI